MSCSRAEVPVEPLPPTGQETGLDLGIAALATLSKWIPLESASTRHATTAARKHRLAKCQRRVSRRKQGSHPRQPSPAQSRQHAGSRPPDGAASAARCPPGDGTCPAAALRRDRSRGVAGCPPGAEPPPCQAHRGRWVVPVLEHPFLQGCECRSGRGGGTPSVHQPDVLWLRRPRLEGLVRPLAHLPALRHQPASGPQRREKHPMARAAPSGTRGSACGDEPRTRRALARAECQKSGQRAMAHANRLYCVPYGRFGSSRWIGAPSHGNCLSFTPMEHERRLPEPGVAGIRAGFPRRRGSSGCVGKALR